MNVQLDGGRDQLDPDNISHQHLEVTSHARAQNQSRMNQSHMNRSHANYQEEIEDAQADVYSKKPAAISFEKAYANMAKDYTQDQSKKSYVTARDAAKHQNGYPHKEVADEAKSRAHAWEQTRLEKIQAQRDLDKDKDLDGCTFAPELVTKKDGQRPRTKKTFLKQQQEFLNNKSQKTEDLKRELTKTYESVTAPTLSTHSKKIVEQKMTERKNVPTYERLYNLNQEKKVKHQQKIMQQETRVIEESRMTMTHGDPERRGAPVHIALNSLAPNKKARVEQMRQQIEEAEQEKIRSGEYKNANSQEIAGNRIKRELDQALQKIELTEESKLSFKLTETILTQLGFLPSKMVKGTDSTDYQLFMDLWSLMQGEEMQGVSRETLEYLLLCMMGNYNLEREVEPEAQGGQNVPKPANLNDYGAYDQDGVFVLRKGGQRKVFNHFNILFANRLTFYKNKPVRDVDAERMKEMPEVNTKSQQLAYEQRKKKIGPAADSGDFVSYIYAKDQVLSQQNQAKAQQIKEQREENNTHKPEVIDYQFTKQRPTYGETHLDLYAKVGKGSIANKRDKQKDEIEIEQNHEEFTMRPKINEDGAHLAEDVDMSQIKGFEHKMTQLNMGRELKENFKKATERGIPASKNRPPTIRQDDLKYVRTKTNKYQSDFGEVTVAVNRRKLNNTYASSKTRPTSFFDSSATMKRQIQKQQDSFATDDLANKEAQQQNDEQVNAEENHQQANDANAVEQENNQKQNDESNHVNEQAQQQEAHDDQDNQQQQQNDVEQAHTENQKVEHARADQKTEQVHADDEQRQEHQDSNKNNNEGDNDQAADHVEPDTEQQQQNQNSQQESDLNLQSSDKKEPSSQRNEDSSVQIQGEAHQISPVKTSDSQAEQSHNENGDQQEERDPKLYVDVNVANYGLQRIVVFEGDTVESLVADFVKRCPIDEFMIEKLKLLLQQQIDGVLERIDEDQEANDEDEEDAHDNNNGEADADHQQQTTQKEIQL